MTGVYSYTDKSYNYKFSKEHVSLILIAFSALTCYNILYNEEQKELSDIKKKILGQESMNCEELKSTIYFLEKTYESNIIGNQTVSDISGVIQNIREILVMEER